MLHFTRQVSRLAGLVRFNSTSSSPLKVLYFGSDDFSIPSLRALHSHFENSNQIKQIDVVLRHTKRSGRGLSIVKDLPLAPVAQSLGLHIIRAETKQELEDLIPSNYDMLIAVSYGKLIPSALIESAKYTLNVHPSLLPKYSGASPLQYALMNDDKTTGVTIQTLHPTKFDHGEIIAQTTEIPVAANEDLESLTEKLGIAGAELLVSVIKNGSFKSPSFKSKYEYSYAGKICRDQKIIDWKGLTTNKIVKRYSALGPLFTFKDIIIKKRRSGVHHERHRVLLSDIYRPSKDVKLSPGQFDFIENEFLVGCKGGIVGIGSLQMQCQKKENASMFWKHLAKRIGDTPLEFVS